MDSATIIDLIIAFIAVVGGTGILIWLILMRHIGRKEERLANIEANTDDGSFIYALPALKSSLMIIHKVGNLVLRYDYIILSFIIVGFLDRILNKRVKVSLN